MSQEQSLAERHRWCNLTVPQIYGYTARVTGMPELTGISIGIAGNVLLDEGSLTVQHYKGETASLRVQGVILKSK